MESQAVRLPEERRHWRAFTALVLEEMRSLHPGSHSKNRPRPRERPPSRCHESGQGWTGPGELKEDQSQAGSKERNACLGTHSLPRDGLKGLSVLEVAGNLAAVCLSRSLLCRTEMGGQ